MLLEGQMKTCRGEREVEKLLCAKTRGWIRRNNYCLQMWRTVKENGDETRVFYLFVCFKSMNGAWDDKWKYQRKGASQYVCFLVIRTAKNVGSR